MSIIQIQNKGYLDHRFGSINFLKIIKDDPSIQSTTYTYVQSKRRMIKKQLRDWKI